MPNTQVEIAMNTALVEPKSVPASSSIWPRYPSLYEINTWVWLSDLSVKYGKPIDLASVPPAEWDTIAAYGFDAVWLMGVWERSPAGIAIANRNPGLLDDFRRALPDFRPEDNVGSAYCIRRYVVDQHLGGPKALAIARAGTVKARHEPAARLRAQPRRARPSVDRRASRVLHPRHRRRCSERTPPAFIDRATESPAPADATPSSRHGQTWSNSTPSSRDFGKPSSKPSPASPNSATASAATWPCFC